MSDSQADQNLPRAWIQPHYSSFNGLRAVAVFLVFLVHFGDYILPKKVIGHMWAGVDLFFVLSGFLITGILYDSLHDPQFFRNFYVRRALRIFPVFYGFFLLLFLLTPILHLSYEPSLLYFFFYIGNLALPFTDLVHHNPTVITGNIHGHLIYGNIGHLWSLCVEEQFYLVWPAVVWFVRSRARLMWVCCVTIVITLLGRIYLESHASQHALSQWLIQWSTYTRIDTLLVGAWFALWLRAQALSVIQLRRLSSVLIAIPVLIFFLCKLFLTPTGNWTFIMTLGYTLIAFAAAGLLLSSLDNAGWVSRLLQNRFVAGFGAVSYGFYFIHHLFMYEFVELVDKYPIVRRLSHFIPFVAFAVSLLLAKLSFRYLESPFLRMKSKLAPQWVPAAVPFSSESGKVSAEVNPVPVGLHVSEPRP